MGRIIGCALAAVMLVAVSAAAAVGADDLKIISAVYRVGGKKTDVTKKLSAMVKDGRLTVTASDELVGRDMPAGKKTLRIIYSSGGRTKFAQVDENKTVTIPEAGAATSGPERTFVLAVEIEGPILSHAYARAIHTGRIEAKNRGVEALVLEINTPGGRLDVAEKMVEEIRAVEDIPTIAWLKGKGALSAGVWVSLACDKIVMSPGTAIGASTPYHFEDGVAKVLEEKFVSALRSQYAAAARAHGRSGALAEATIDPGLEIWKVKRGDTLAYVDKLGATDADRANRVRVVCPAGKLLSVSAHEALKLGLADAIVRDDDILGAIVGVTGIGRDTLTYRKSRLAAKKLARELAAEEKDQRASEKRRRNLERKWRGEWERLQKAEVELRAMDPAGYRYRIYEGTHRFVDGGKAWREHSEKAIKEASRCVDALNELIEIVEKVKDTDKEAAGVIKDMERYRQEVRVYRRRLETRKDMKGLAE